VYFPASVEYVGEGFFGGGSFDEEYVGVFESRPKIEQAFNRFQRQYSQKAMESCATEIEIVNTSKKSLILYCHPSKGNYSTAAYVVEPSSTFKKSVICAQISLQPYSKKYGTSLPRALPNAGFFNREVEGGRIRVFVGKFLIGGFYAGVKN
jgi:hypothetical protein